MSNAVRELIARYVEDRDALDEAEFAQLVEGLKNAPSLAAELRAQLTLDDMLAQKLAVDRRDFLSQVSQRVNDYERQVAETFDQVTELRAMAEKERPGDQEPTSRLTWWLSLASAAAILLAVGLGLGALSFGGRSVVAEVQSVKGAAEITNRDGVKRKAAVGDRLRIGDEVTTFDGELVWKYVDETIVRLESNSIGRLASHADHHGKRVHLDHGALFSSISKQKDGQPMTFVTPHAEATVRGTQLRLVIGAAGSELKVTEGVVDFARKEALHEPQQVSANQSCIASERLIERYTAEWPVRRDEICLQMPHEDNLLVVRNPGDFGKWLETPLYPEGPKDTVGFRPGYALHFRGGAFQTEDGGQDLVKLFRDRDHVTVEFAFVPAENLAANATLFDLRAEGQRPNLTLSREGGDWKLQLSTDQGQHQPAELRFPYDAQPKQLMHFAMTYRPGEWKAYLDGKKVAERNDVHGNLNGWQEGKLSLGADVAKQSPFKGVMFSTACYRRVLDEREVGRNARASLMRYGLDAEQPLP